MELKEPKDRICVAVDIGTLAVAEAIVETLAPYASWFKLGLELLTAGGAPQVVAAIRTKGAKRIILDGKFHDIPATMAGAARGAARLEVDAFTVHASAGARGVTAAVGERGNAMVLGVTVLTSHDEEECKSIFGTNPVEKVLQFARMLDSADAQGVICSPKEIEVARVMVSASEIQRRLLRESPSLVGAQALLRLRKFTPGVRPSWASTDDQARALTPGEAIRAGADVLIIGRPILQPPLDRCPGGPIEAAQRIADEIAEAMEERTP